ncbi:MAG TPA: sugar phosphorylase [Bacteroidetes bacterium]|nr:sugar phosphorylase [Bacteroidota bacterium]
MEKIDQLLLSVYTKDKADYIKKNIQELWQKYKVSASPEILPISHKDVVLITYADQLYKKGENRLQTLHRFLNKYLNKEISIVHLLPFYPFTSDDGFSVSNYYDVDPENGTWKDIDALSKDYNLLFDAVINHSSKKMDWFTKFLAGDEKYKGFYKVVDSTEGYENVTRPRTSPLTHSYLSANGAVNVWTTFSEDQVDLNFEDPDLLIQVLDVLLFYISKGASIIRLDAVGFIWKEKNTTCMHLPQTHALVKLMRLVVNHINPSALLLSETNVPHQDNISYFGQGDEANMVYNFTLPPLLAFSLLNANTDKLKKWFLDIKVPFKNVCYFNFLASHDGIGVMPVVDRLNENELNSLIKAATANGGRVSYKSNGKGSKIPYEINSNYLSLLCGENQDESLGIKRSLLAHAVLLSMPGLPAIYFHSIIGSLNDIKGMEESGINRRINREKLEFNQLEKQLEDTNSRRAHILQSIKKLINIRAKEPSFDPYGDYELLDTDKGVFAILRKGVNNQNNISCFYNFTQEDKIIDFNDDDSYVDIISNKKYMDAIIIKPLSFIWLKLITQ